MYEKITSDDKYSYYRAFLGGKLSSLTISQINGEHISEVYGGDLVGFMYVLKNFSRGAWSDIPFLREAWEWWLNATEEERNLASVVGILEKD